MAPVDFVEAFAAPLPAVVTTLIPLQYSANRDEALTEDWKQGMITRAPVGLPVVW